MRVLITGGGGRLGINVCKTFLMNGFEVRVVDMDTRHTRKSIKNLGGKVEIIWGDITHPDLIRQAMEETDAVVHMAAVLPPVSDENPELATRVNVGGTRNIVGLIKERGGHIPFVYTSSVVVFGPTPDVTEPLNPEKDTPKPVGVYAETKFQGESVIKEAGVDYVILRLASGWRFTFTPNDINYMFKVPLDARVEICHPDDVSLAMLSAIKNFDSAKGNTLIVSSGANGRILHKERVCAFLGALRLPSPPASKFNQEPFHMNWYDTTKSEELLHFQRKTFDEFILDYRRELARRYSPLFLPLMRFIGPIFGKLIIRHI
jgi:nucleoside-diphosphate-sugar epimerase